MGSTELMEEQTRHRRRQASKQSLVQVPSGEAEDEQDGNYYYSRDSQKKDSSSNSTLSKSNKKLRKRRRRRSSKDDTPFAVLFFQVGVTLLIFCSISVFLYRKVHPYDPHEGMIEEIVYIGDADDDAPNSDSGDGSAGSSPEAQEYTAEDEAKIAQLIKEHQKEQGIEDAASKVKATPPPLPTFDLSPASKWDAFGLLDESSQEIEANIESNPTFWQAAKGLRQRFVEYYGTENIARMLLDEGMTTFFNEDGTNGETTVPDDIVSTACRFQAAQQANRPFHVAFGGYSVTAGRGNKFEQSFPFQLERIIETVVKLAGIPAFTVRNAAIGGCPAFPYGWCMTNFWGETPDVVSWDYSMNEAGGISEGMEAYVRHLLTTYNSTEMPSPPKLIVKDTYLANQRRDVLGAYASLLKDPVVVHTSPAIKPMMQIEEDEHRPLGFRDWRKFGAPPGAPGQALHHPAVKEHELIGWMLAMHFLTALEYLMAHSTKEKPLLCPENKSTPPLPKPVSGAIEGDGDESQEEAPEYEGILFGHSLNDKEWKINPVHCRTTFQPILDGDLSTIVVSGTTAEDLDVSLPKSQMYYNTGWTFDLSEDEKTAKRKLSLYEDGLGFIDSKEAYYGIYESPAMELFLPYETKGMLESPEVGQLAGSWFESVVICQVNEKRDPGACNIKSDLGFSVGGVNATDSANIMTDTGTVYLGKPVCTRIGIPSTATLTSHNTLSPENALEVDQVGLLVSIKVTSPLIAHINQACSVSHVVWEEHNPDVQRASQA